MNLKKMASLTTALAMILTILVIPAVPGSAATADIVMFESFESSSASAGWAGGATWGGTSGYGGTGGAVISGDWSYAQAPAFASINKKLVTINFKIKINTLPVGKSIPIYLSDITKGKHDTGNDDGTAHLILATIQNDMIKIKPNSDNVNVEAPEVGVWYEFVLNLNNKTNWEDAGAWPDIASKHGMSGSVSKNGSVIKSFNGRLFVDGDAGTYVKNIDGSKFTVALDEGDCGSVVLDDFEVSTVSEVTVFEDNFEGGLSKWGTKGSVPAAQAGVGYGGTSGLKVDGGPEQGYIRTADALSLDGKNNVISMKFKMTETPTMGGDESGIRVHLYDVEKVHHNTPSNTGKEALYLFLVNNNKELLILPNSTDKKKVIDLNRWYEIIVRFDVTTPYENDTWPPAHRAAFTLIDEDGNVEEYLEVAMMGDGWAIKNLTSNIQLYAVSGAFILDDLSVTQLESASALTSSASVAEGQENVDINEPIVLEFNREVKLKHTYGLWTSIINAAEKIVLTDNDTSATYNPNTVSYQGGNKKILVCDFSNAPLNGDYTLSVEDVADFYGTLSAPMSVSFSAGFEGFYKEGAESNVPIDELADEMAGTVGAIVKRTPQDLFAVLALYEKVDEKLQLVNVKVEEYNIGAFPADGMVSAELQIDNDSGKDYVLKFFTLGSMSSLKPMTDAISIKTN